ncbi:3-hydroxyacyl-CoA dehydrogenase NAD-binding domain-containing protein [Rugosimonospora africana]|uniref:3-hydroxyacyl-CoA dehydrogenase n=1 Tax=Rugosimonospora africana TaxID=556532 RepID=A0A8J3QMR3_9ACTN|nr:3-hydroxyacyl-CoA dehydrogenase NAD-binding domain-containing protein [Rugosimonospora africana]GIH13799.1 3-hydroxyacyl-CoA dehydrogenase [Rugosimonospora africana]
MSTPDFASEVVTKALLRQVNVPGLAKPAALITLDNGLDYKKPNSFGPAGLASLDAAITEALAADPAFIAVTGKPYVFSVGADVTGMALITSKDQAVAIGQEGHRILRRLKDSTVPTFAFVNGAAMGGGLELALHCHYRTVSGGAAAIALPEVSLGLIPGWGGTQLLPNLIGVIGAAQVIVQNPLQMNKMLRPAEARELGIFDELFEPADFLERSLEWAASVVSGQTSVERPEVDRSEMWDAVLGFARQQLDERLHGGPPAPYRALDLLALAKTEDFADGTAAEDQALADLLMTNEQRASLYAFDLVQRRAKRPAGAPSPGLAREVTKVGIVGAGLMAGQIALLFARRMEVPVVLTDLDQARVDKGVAYVHQEIEKLANKGRLNPGKAAKLRGLVTGDVDKAGFADADLVIEAVFENLDVKKQVWAEVEKIVSPECVLATNTSSLSVTAMAEHLEHPERVVGFHFFNPVSVMPLLEIVRAAKTDDATLATAFAVGKQLRKSCVLVKDAPSFVVNRLLTRFLGEILGAIDAGTPLDVANQALDPLGLPMRPLALLTMVGPAVALHVGETLHEAFPDRFGVSENLGRIVEAGKPLTDRDGAIDPEVAALLKIGDTALTAEQVRDRALTALAQEVRLMLDEGVVAEAQDIDLCMILGAGWPFHLGGVTPYLDRAGYAQPRFLPPGVASLPA